MSAEDLVLFWEKSAKNDLKVAEDNFKLGHYHWALFFLQLVLEKTLKSLVVKRKKKIAPPTHNLVRLAKEANIPLSEKQKRDFQEISTFNIEARYDDIKLSFYKKATKEFTKMWVDKCRKYYQWLKKI